MNNTIPDRAKACQVCRRVLALLETPDGEQRWVHGLQDDGDHLPVPVDQTEVKVLYRCDFCNADDETSYILPVANFQLPVRGEDVEWRDEDGPRPLAGDDWGCCPVCAKYINTNQWSQLLRRAIIGWEQSQGVKVTPPIREALARLHRQVRKNVRGALYPFVPPVVASEPSQEAPGVAEWGQARAGGRERLE